MSKQWGFTTKAIHGGKMPDVHKAVAPPIYQTATFYYDTAEEGARLGQEIPPGYIYTRWANPTTRALEEKVALLESGEDALATSSGMGAVSAAVLTAVKPGHHDVTAGVIVGRAEFIKRAKRQVRIFGATADPFGAWLVIRGLATLALRVERQNASARRVAEFLAGHQKVSKVYYPGLAAHPGHAVARRQMRGFGGMLSFEVKGGYAPGVRAFEALQVCKRATSLGGISTLVSHPAGISSVQMPKDVREAAGIAEGLIRVSVGIEDAEDLLNDFEQALRQA